MGSAQWMFGHEAMLPGRLGRALAYYNPMRWSGSTTLAGVLRQLSEVPVKQQPVRINFHFPCLSDMLPKVLEFVQSDNKEAQAQPHIPVAEAKAEEANAETLPISEYFMQQQFDHVPALARKVLSYWLGAGYNGGDGSDIAAEQYHLWFGKSEETDSEIKALFGGYLVDVADGKFDFWRETPLGAVALVILMDQFPRNIYRNTARSFGYDWKASEITWTALNEAMDDNLKVMERVWLYLVLTHTEDQMVQKECVDLAKRKLDGMEGNFRKMWIIIFEKHLTVIEKFGRFPHRNKFMHRHSTADEDDFVNDPKYRFDLPVTLTEDPNTGAKGFNFIAG